MPRREAILFDLLTALIDSWTLWDDVAGSRDAGRRWRAAYLQLTYGCGAYRPYDALVDEAARATGLASSHARALAARWEELQPWDDAADFLAALPPGWRTGVVTNCSEELGARAARRVGTRFDVIVTAEGAGHYKPHPAPYRAALARLGLPPERVLFVAGSAFDLFGTGALGIPTLWHNRAALGMPPGAPRPLAERRTLRELIPFVTEQAA